MPDANNRENEIVSLIKRLVAVEKDSELIEFLNQKYGASIKKQQISNFRSSGAGRPTITKLFLMEMAEYLESINSEEHKPT